MQGKTSGPVDYPDYMLWTTRKILVVSILALLSLTFHKKQNQKTYAQHAPL